MPKSARARSLLAHVMALAAAMTVPPMVLAIVTTTTWVRSERLQLENVMRENTERAVAQVDRYLGGKIAMLQALATSPAIDLGDFQRLDAQARELLDLQGLNIVMRDLKGQQLVNTRVPWATPLPTVPNHQVDQEVTSNRAPVVSDFYVGVMARGPLIRVIVPVIRNDEVWYTLTASLAPTVLTTLLREAGLEEPYVGSIADRTGRILARGTEDAALIGKELPGFRDLQGTSGDWSGTNVESVQVRGHWLRSPLSGWTFTIGVDQAVLDAPLYRSLVWLGSLAIALGVLGFAASSAIARRMVLSHRRVEACAEALGRGEAVEAPVTPLLEANRVGEALAEASVRIRQQADALVLVNRSLEKRVDERTRMVREQSDLLKATLDNMDQGLMLVDQDGTVPICNERAMQLLDLPPALMASKPAFASILTFQSARNEFARSGHLQPEWVEWQPQGRLFSYERERPDGTVLEIRTVPLATGGAVRTYTDITIRKQAERLSQHMARHDSLTGLPNRILLRERLTADLCADVAPFAVLCFDLDRFKIVNDTLGHPAGDTLLRVVADRVGELVAPPDVFARVGGDEFAIIQVGGAQPHAASALAHRIVEAVREPIDIDGRPVHVGASVGIAIAPVDGRDADQIFKNADLALYDAKNNGRGTFRFYRPEMDAAVQERQRIETALREALAAGGLEVHYQPVVKVRDGTVSSFEALLRWRRPDGSFVPPSDFIGVAEETRLIVPIGSWILREACREAMKWPREVRVQINVSAVQVEDPGLVAAVLAALASSGLSPSRLQLEITETVLMHQSPTVMEALESLREFGVGIALDDFGTGYASLGYLQRMPLNAIKIDRSFVQSGDDLIRSAIFDAIVGLGRTLGIPVTAEGVETADHLDRVKRARCEEAQGFYFSPAVSGPAALLLLARTPRSSAA